MRAVQSGVRLVPDPAFADKERERPATVRVHLTNGQTLEKHVPAVRGTSDNPMTRDEVEAKALDLLEDILGKERARRLVGQMWTLERLRSVRDLRPLLRR